MVAFLGSDDRVIVKVPAGDDIHSGESSATLEKWSALAKESSDYVRSQPQRATSRTRRQPRTER
jgi:hypothetical protein